MKLKIQKLNAVAQNVVIGSITGVIVGYNLRLIFLRLGGVDFIWILFFIMGPLIGYFSGKERRRLERLKSEKMNLEKNLDKIQDALNTSEKKYRLLVERANDAIFLTSENGKFLLFNQATCLLSGYSKDELKNMSLPQLEFEKDAKDKLDKAWLDNGICRYEESWKNKNGSAVFLDMSAKWIQFSNYRLILYIARDIQRKKESNMRDKIKDFQLYQKNRLMEITSIHQGYNKHVSNLVSNTVKKIVDLEKQNPRTFQHFSDLLSEWKETHKILGMLSLKNSRDLNTSPIQWNLNDMIMQELYCLELLNDSKDFIARTSFDSKMPMVFGRGQDFSIIFGFVFQTILESINESNEKELHILTRCMDDEAFVEIRTNKPIRFEENMVKVINPFFHSNNLITTDQIEKEFSFCQIFIESFGMKLSVNNNEKTVIRITVPTTETIKNEVNEAAIDYSTNSVMYQ